MESNNDSVDFLLDGDENKPIHARGRGRKRSRNESKWKVMFLRIEEMKDYLTFLHQVRT